MMRMPPSVSASRELTSASLSWVRMVSERMTRVQRLMV